MSQLTSAELKKIEDQILKALPALATEAFSWFQRPLEAKRKRDRTLVSEADQSIEMFTRNLLKNLTPDFGFMGEEFGRLKFLRDHKESDIKKSELKPSEDLDARAPQLLNVDTETHWLLDPIDGTINFLSHVPLWSTLLALIEKGQPILGVVLLPGLDEFFIASKDHGARFGRISNPHALKPCYLAPQVDLDDAHLSCSSPSVFQHRGLSKWYQALSERPGEMRTHSDAFGYTRVLCGGIHGMIDCVAASYDLAAIQILFDETPGAAFTSLQGHTHGERYRMGSAIGTCDKSLNSALRAQLAEVLAGQEPMDSPFLFKTKDLQQLSFCIEKVTHEALKKSPDLFIEDVSISYRKGSTIHSAYANGKPQSPPSFSTVSGINARVVANRKVSFVSASVTEEDLVFRLAVQVLRDAFAAISTELTDPDTGSTPALKPLLASRDMVHGHFGHSFPMPDHLPGRGLDHAKALTLERNSAHLSTLEASAKESAQALAQVFLDGSQQTQMRQVSQWRVGATVARGEERRQASHRGFVNGLLSGEDWQRVLATSRHFAVRDATALLDAPYTPENVAYDFLAIDADLLGLILHEAIGHASEGDLIQTGASGFGENGHLRSQQVAVPWMDIVIDGRLETCGWNPVDAEGVVPIRKAIVRNGMLVEALHTRETARALGGVVDGAARAESFAHPSLNRMSNIWIQVHESHLEEVPPGFDVNDPVQVHDVLQRKGLMRDQKRVLYLKGWKGGTASCSNLEFRADVAMVYLMREGLPPQLLRQANFTGLATACLQAAVAAFGKTYCESTGVCGKDGQNVPTSDGGPALLVMRRHPQVQVIGLGEVGHEEPN